ncbi:MAG: ClbS/DfsB family four-helix bundle protein [Propionibacteriaceae bacterium]|nr:ClbS/DfsB family four-helix bundle protein [Propionibacteriaceae bacterium]
MPRPKNSTELIEAATSEYDKLMALVTSIPAEQQELEFAFEDRDRTVRDVLAHLSEWHYMMSRWYDQGMSGEKPIMPADGYTWKTLPELNLRIWEEAQEIPLDKARAELDETHQVMMTLITHHSDEELFTKKYYPWTGTTSLGAYLISSTSSHYDWASKKLKKAIKTWKG